MNKNTALDLFKIFGALIVAASAALTFAFFWTFLPSLIPTGVIDAWTASMISGVLGVLIFDAGALAWLKIYLDGSENNDQRAIAMQTSILDIAGSATASFAQILLTGTGLVDLDPATRITVGWASLFAVALTLCWNFVSVWRFHKNSDMSKLAIREADRLGRIREAEESQADELDELIAQKVGEKLASLSNELAEQQAERIVRRRVDLEQVKYQNRSGSDGTSSGENPNSRPKWTTNVTRRENGQGQDTRPTLNQRKSRYRARKREK